MFDKRKNKTLLCICSFGAVIAVICLLIANERQYCMNVPVISESKLDGYSETTLLDISLLSFNEEDVAVDFPSNTVYISQSPEKLTHFYELQGELESITPEYSLYFLDTPAMENIAGSVSEGTPFTLIIKCGTTFQRVNVVITTLPVLYLDIENTYENEEGHDIVAGDLTLWNNLDSSIKGYKTSTSAVEWHIRGNSSKIYPKLSWKLTLKKENGENNDLDLLGLGNEDDDWILNPMSMDDTKLKEKLTQELWSQLATSTNYNDKMSSGEYVELFINGAYQGLYLLQRRVDAKYLNLDQTSDVLLKGQNTWEPETFNDGYEIISTPLKIEETYLQFEKALFFEGGSYMNINNFIDVNLMVQFISGADNIGYKNMFYALRKSNEAYELSLIPWDTDLSFGVNWGYSYEESMNQITERQELETVRKYVLDIDKQIAERWNALRDNIYSEENIFSIYDNLARRLSASGAMQRDEECWGLLHEGEDNWENLQKFIEGRLIFLDEYYTGIMKSN